jgi:tetratricopeptide (TPR) repeat protein
VSKFGYSMAMKCTRDPDRSMARQSYAGFSCTPFRSVLLLATLLLAGCVGVLPQQTEEVESGQAVVSEDSTAADRVDGTTRQLEPEVMFNTLVGEIAAQRGRFDLAIPHYLEAARRGRDSALAARATRFALFANEAAMAREAGEMWLSFDPASKEALQLLVLIDMRAGEVESAAERVLAYLALAPDDRGDMLDGLVQLLHEKRSRDNLLPLFGLLARELPDDPDIALIRARLAFEGGDNELAYSEAVRAEKLRGGWRSAAAIEAHALVRMERMDEAVARLRQALVEYPDDHDLRMQLARIMVDLDRLDAAGELFDEVLERDPDNGDALYARALLAMQAEEREQARTYLLRLNQLGVRTGESRYYLGILSEELGDEEAALNYLSSIDSLDYLTSGLARHGEILARRGQYGALNELFNDRRRSFPAVAADLYRIEADLLRNHQRLEQAMELYDEAVGRFPESDDLLYSRALLGEQLGRLDILERDLRLLIERDPENARALNALGYTLTDQTDRHQEAFELIERALELQPDDAAILDSMGWVYYRLGRIEDALAYLTRAMETMPDPEIAAHLGEVLWQLGRKEEARLAWQEGLKLDGNHELLLNVIRRFEPQVAD